MKSYYWWIIGLVVVALIFFLNVYGNKKEDSSTQNKTVAKEESKNTVAEKIQIYEFHSTNRCYSCVTMGKYIRETLEEFFQSELRDGKIDFREINVDLPENKAIAAKFRATGTSVFFNLIIDGKDNIQEEIQAWRLLGNKKTFSDYLVKKIREMIGEAVSVEVKKEMDSKHITFYTGNNFFIFKNIKKYLEENNVKNKIVFEEKNVNQNEIDVHQMAEDAMHCDIDPEFSSVPFFWSEGKCYTNEEDIIGFFNQKIS